MVGDSIRKIVVDDDLNQPNISVMEKLLASLVKRGMQYEDLMFKALDRPLRSLVTIATAVYHDNAGQWWVSGATDIAACDIWHDRVSEQIAMEVAATREGS